ncbi:exosome complex component RRP40-like [Varroa jacobsoni]|uniref:Ribosomal RNA-processing protein 40 n=1 Tax=Varroa destructor TaxID=109461 RepID=A0A7M7K9U7_VARDE|nr:exosome complex component RRP40-like [Varroa destructor]XP_022703562.1 exosome complex component RRP40-like [Varroa jacobsoni]XP_022703563.1 exosome complex component RRP40-like [Varroa jacobsoni]
MSSSTGLIANPGDEIKVDQTHSYVILGPGLLQDGPKRVVATRAGILHFKKPHTYWLESHVKKYWPARGDCVIGCILQKVGDNFRVNIWGPEPATLSAFAFEGATKRNRPNLKPGDLLYCQIISAHTAMEAEVVCVNSYGRRGSLGVLESDTSTLITLPLEVIHMLLSKECPLLTTLGKKIQYELAIGQNGKVWVNGSTIEKTMQICTALKACTKLSIAQIRDMCQRIAGS